MALTVSPITPVSFPNATPGQTVGRTLELIGATQPTAENVTGEVTITFNGTPVAAPINVTVDRPAVTPTASVTLNTPGVVEVTVQNIRPRDGFNDRWYMDLLVTTL